MARMLTWLQAHPDRVVIRSAAVGDYEVQAADDELPAGRGAGARPTPKILGAEARGAPVPGRQLQGRIARDHRR